MRGGGIKGIGVGRLDGPLVTAPGFELEVLRVLVPLPVVLAAKGFVASGEGASVGFFVSFHMFSVEHSAGAQRMARDLILHVTVPW